MAPKRWFEKSIDKYKDDFEFKLEGLLIDINERICELLDVKKVSRAELAGKLGTSRAFVTKLLNGYPNMTLKTLLSIANALECELDVSFPPRGYGVLKSHYKPLPKFIPPENIHEYKKSIKTTYKTSEITSEEEELIA